MKENKKEYEKFDGMPVAFVVIEAVKKEDGTVTDFLFRYANQAYLDLFHFSSEQIINHSLCAVFPRALERMVSVYIGVSQQGGKEVTVEHIPEVQKMIEIRCYQTEPNCCGCLLYDVTKKEQKERETLLGETVAGGMMGGYMEEKFPFYFINQRMLEYLGYDTEEEFVADNEGFLSNCMHPDQRGAVAQAVEKQLKRKQEYTVEYQIRKKDGSYIWVHDIGKQMVAENGKAAITSVCYDITKEKELMEQLALYRASSYGGVFTVKMDKDFTLVYGNDIYYQIHEYTKEGMEQIIGNACIQYIHPDDRKHIAEVLEQALANNRKTFSWEMRIITGKGRLKYVVCTCAFVAKEEGTFLSGFVIDETEQRRTQEQLARSEASLRAALDHANLYFWEYDIQTEVCKNGYKSIRDLEMPEYMEDYPRCVIQSGFIHPDSADTFLEMHDALKKGVPRITRDIKVNQEDGSVTWKHICYTTVFDEKNRPLQAFGTSEDLDAYKDLEQRMEIIMAQSNIQTFLLDIPRRTLFYGEPVQEKFGVGRWEENVPGVFFERDSIHPEDREELNKMYEKIYAGGKMAQSATRWREGRYKEWRWYRTTFTTVFSKDNVPIKAIGSSMDITQEKLAEKKYQDAIAFSQITSHNALISLVLNLTQNKIEKVESRIPEMADLSQCCVSDFFKMTKEGIIGAETQKKYGEIFNRDVLLQRFEQGETDFTFQMRKRVSGGRVAWISTPLTLIKHPQTEDVMAFTYALDIDEQKVSADILQHVTYKLYDLMMYIDGNAKTATVYQGGQGTPIIWENYDLVLKKTITQAVQNYVNLDLQDILGKMSLERIQKELSNQNDYVFPLLAVGVGGRTTYHKHHYSYLSREDNIIILVRTDNTDIYQREEEKNLLLAQALEDAQQASRAKSLFLSSMSHDIRTPMNAIVGMAEIAKEEMDNREKVKESLEIITSSSNHLLSLINDVLDMAKIESGNMVLTKEGFDLKEVIKRMKAMVMPMFLEKNQTFTVRLKLVHHRFMGDAMRLNRVLINLLNNASKFTPEGGKISLVFEEKEMLSPNVASILFSVKDNGIGIPKEKQQGIFEPFYREGISAINQIEGAGLGLAITKSIVDEKGGRIWLESEVGKGSTFYVEAPMQLEESGTSTMEKKKIPSKTASGILENRTVLLVEDHPINTLVATRLLEKQGARVVHGENGEKGYEIFINSDENEFDVIFMDIQMPVMNGYEATKAIRQSNHPHGKTIPIVAMTANVFAEDVAKAKAVGMNAHIGKPIDVETIMEIVGTLWKGETDK